MPLRYNFYKGTQQFKLLNSNQIRQARICCIFSVNNLPIILKYFYNFFANFASVSKKYTTFAFGKNLVFAIFLKIKKRIALTCNGKRRKFSKGASMASGSRAICVSCNFHFFANWFSYDHPLKCGNSVHAFIV